MGEDIDKKIEEFCVIKGKIDENIEVYGDKYKISLQKDKIYPSESNDKKIYMVDLTNMEIPDPRFVRSGHYVIVGGKKIKKEKETDDDILAEFFINEETGNMFLEESTQ